MSERDGPDDEAVCVLLDRAPSDEDAAAALTEFIVTAADPCGIAWQRAAITFPFSRVADPAAVEATILRVWDRHASLRPVLAQACERAKYRSAVSRLIELLDANDPSGWSVQCACEALGALGAVEAVPHIAILLDDGRPSVAESVARALGRLGGEDAARTLWDAFLAATRADSTRLGHLAGALGQMQPSQADAILVASYDDDPTRRYWAARALGSCDDPRAPDRLAELLDDDATAPSGGQVSTAARRGLKTWQRRSRSTEQDEVTG